MYAARATSDARVAEIIHDAARKVASGAGRRQAYISDVWAQIVRDGDDGGMTMYEYKAELSRLARAGHVQLGRSGRRAPAMSRLESYDVVLLPAAAADAGRAWPAHGYADLPADPAPTFAARVVALAAAAPPSAWFGDRRVYIGDVWEAARRDHALRDMGETAFKRELIAAHQRAELVLARADLVAAMPPEKVRASETTKDLGGHKVQFHFIVIAPKRNPCDAGRGEPYVDNPPKWMTTILANTYETLEDTLPAMWLPRITDVTATSKTRIRGKVTEYGCGAYGCVLPTLDQTIVLKITTDSTEAEFAAKLSPTLVASVCVRYYTVVRTDEWHDNRQVYLLWRDSAEHAGRMVEYVDDLRGSEDGDRTLDLIDRQHDAAQVAYHALVKGEHAMVPELIRAWLSACDEMGAQTRVPELQHVGAGMARVYREQGIFFGDVHSGNLGLCDAPDGRFWRIIDPGHVAVVRF